MSEHDTSPDANPRMVELEIALSHQQHLVGQLNEVVVSQSRQLMRLEADVKQLQSQHKELRERLKQSSGNLPDEKPPHY